MGINFEEEISSLDDWELTHQLDPTSYKLLVKLYSLARRDGFQGPIRVSNKVLISLVGVTEPSLIRARQKLIQLGRITYDGNRKTTPKYEIVYFRNNLKILSYTENNLNNVSYTEDIPKIYRSYSGDIAEDGHIYNNIYNYRATTEEEIGVEEEPEEEKYNNHSLESAHAREEEFPPSVRGRDPDWKMRQFEVRLYQEDERCRKELIGLFGRDSGAALKILASGRYPLEMVLHGFDLTRIRNEQYLLGNPLAYLKKLLRDWDENQIYSVEQLEQAKQDGSYAF